MRQKIQKIPRKAFSGKIDSVEYIPSPDPGGISGIKLFIQGEQFTIWAKYGTSWEESELNKIPLSNGFTLENIKPEIEVRFLYYLGNSGYKQIQEKDLESFEIVKPSKEEGNPSSSFIPLIKCPNCGEKMKFIREEVVKAGEKIVVAVRNFEALVLGVKDE